MSLQLALGAAALVAVLSAGYGGFRLGVDHEVAARTREDQHVAKAVEAATGAAALAISKIRVVNTKIMNEVQREIQTHKIYQECKLPPQSFKLLNEALGGRVGQKAAHSESESTPFADVLRTDDTTP